MRLLSVSAAALVCALAVGACKRERERQVAAAPLPPPADHPTDPGAIPRVTGAIVLDGELSEPDWSRRALRRQFTGSDGELARPSSEVRFLRDDTTLYVGLYAADENIETSDAFTLSLGTLALRISATGNVTSPTGAVPDVRTGLDRDGTLDDPRDDDEEWVIELAVPLAHAGLSTGPRVDVRAARCDVTKDHVERCGAWAGALRFE